MSTMFLSMSVIDIHDVVGGHVVFRLCVRYSVYPCICDPVRLRLRVL